ncbi:MAG: hypothetical protein K5770_09860 [Lachnospiraceae bacterium]|nr:hypothetical protein [Lachnospiraceae bacterium]
MAVYRAPEGYQYDDNTGLYYTQVMAADASGSSFRVVTWFNPDTGEYDQQIYPLGSEKAGGFKQGISERAGRLERGISEKAGTPAREISGKPLTKKALIPALAAAAAVITILLIGGLKFGWFGAADKTEPESAEGVRDEAQDSSSSEEGDISDLIQIYNHNNERVSFLFFGKQLEGIDGLNHVAFHVGDYSISVDDWDNNGNLSQCSVWVRNFDDTEGVSFKLFKDAQYHINDDQIITIDTDFKDIPEIDPYNMTLPCSFHVEYLNGGNYTYDFEYNSVVFYDGAGTEGGAGSKGGADPEGGTVQGETSQGEAANYGEDAYETARYFLGRQQSINSINAGEAYHYEDYFDYDGEFWSYRFDFNFDGDGNIVWAGGSYLSLEDMIKDNTSARINEDVGGEEIETVDYYMKGAATAGVRLLVKGYIVVLEADFDNQRARTFLENVDPSADGSSLFAYIDGGECEFRAPEDLEEMLETAKSEGWDRWWEQ